MKFGEARIILLLYFFHSPLNIELSRSIFKLNGFSNDDDPRTAMTFTEMQQNKIPGLLVMCAKRSAYIRVARMHFFKARG